MAGRAYLGMVFVFDDRSDLEDARRKIVSAGIKNGLKWIEPDLKISVEMTDGRYIVKEYESKEETDDLLIVSGVEWLSVARPKKTYEFKEKELKEYMEKYWDRIGESNVVLCSAPFPPDKYLNRYGIEYDRKRPWLKTHQEGGSCVYIYKENKIKPAIIIDFWSVSKYIEDSDPPLSNAVEEFLVDLMRDIVKATEPEYAYFDENEYTPLEMDPVCEDMEGLMGRTRYPDMDVIYVLESHLLAIKKSYLEKWIGKEGIEEIKSGKNICRDGKAKIEDLGKWYMMYCEGFIPHLYYFYYEDKKRTKKYSKVLELMRECRREKGVGIYGICGDNERGYTLKVSSLKKYRDEEIEEFIKDMAWKKGLKVNKVIIYH